MKKAFILLLSMWYLLAMSSFATSMGDGVSLGAVINPSNWGLDEVITQIVSAVASFIVGFFIKSPAERKNNKKDFYNKY